MIKSVKPTLIALIVIIGASAAWAVPCFPGAEGFGVETPGGRGGRVIAVTSLQDSGPGTLREACEAKGPRTVVFRVSGYIRLQKKLRITEPYITIAGQTAPGMGICIRDAVVTVETHDVVMRFLRFRVGSSLNEPFDEQNVIEVAGEGAHHIVIDHCSFSWGIDENVGIVSRAHDVTFSYNIVSEALRQPFTKGEIGKERSHSMGFILGNHPDRCTVHHNLIANCNSRNPRIQGGTHDFVNNVVYDWGFLTGTFSREPSVNFIGNYYKAGPSSNPIKAIVDGSDIGRIYVSGNISPQRPSLDLPEWENLTDADPAEHRASQPFETAPLAITSAEQAYDDVLSYAGCRLPGLDAVDARIIRQTRLGFGVKVDRPENVGGFARLPIEFGPRDSDGDGMPDDYETARRLDPSDPSDGRMDRDGEGYTNLEDYLNSLVEEWMNEPAKIMTYPVPDAVTDSPYTVIAGGRRVPIERVGGEQGAYYARFQFTRGVRVTVEGQGTLALAPERYRDGVSAEGNRLSFDVRESGPRIITCEADGRDLVPLFVIADDWEKSPPKPGDRGVYDIGEYGAARIQQALDDCSSRVGGIVYFGPGVYRTGTLRIGDNTTVYLAPGALIQGSENAADYRVNGEIPDGACGSGALILFDHCRNSELRGYGVIDGMGHIVRNVHGERVHLVDMAGCTNVRVEDVVLRNSSSWTLHIKGSDKVFVEDVKIISDWAVANTDGIDPDGSRNVYIRRCFGYCGDDAVAIKTTGKDGFTGPTENVEVRDSVVMTRKTALKVGTETRADIRDVLFEACDVVRSSRGIGLWMRDGHTISDVTFRDINLDLREFEGEGMSGEPIRSVIEDRAGIGSIRDVLFDRVRSSAPYRSIFAGMPESKLARFDFWGCDWRLTPRTIKTAPTPVLDISNARDFTFKICSLSPNPSQSAAWTDFIRLTDSERVANERFGGDGK